MKKKLKTWTQVLVVTAWSLGRYMLLNLAYAENKEENWKSGSTQQVEWVQDVGDKYLEAP